MRNILFLLVFLMIFAPTYTRRRSRHHNKAYTAAKASYAMAMKRDGLPLTTLDTLLMSLAKPTKSFTFGGCTLDVAGSKPKFTLKVDTKCSKAISLENILKSLLPTINLESASGKFINPGIFTFVEFVLDMSKNDISLTCAANEPFDIIEGSLKVNKASLKVSIANFKKDITFESFGVDIKGEVKIKQTDVPITVTKTAGSPEIKFSMSTAKILASDVAALFSKAELEKKTDAPQKVDLFTKAELVSPTITGARNKDKSFEMVAKGDVKGVGGIASMTMFLLIQKAATDAAKVAFVADLKGVEPAKIINTVTGKDLSNLPLINNLKMDVALEIASGDILQVTSKDVQTLLKKYITTSSTIAEGAKIKIEIPMQDILKKAKPDASAEALKNVPKKMVLTVMVTKDGVDFKFPDKVQMELLNILLVFIPKIPPNAFDPVFATPPKISVKTFKVNAVTGEVEFKAATTDTIRIGNNIIEISEAEFSVLRTVKGDWDFTMKAKKKIAGVDFDLSIVKKGEAYTFKGTVKQFTSKQLVQHFGGEDIAKETFDKFPTLNFGVDNVAVESTFGVDLSLRVTGNPVLFGSTDLVNLEGFIFQKKETKNMALGISLKGVGLDQIIEKLFTKKIPMSSLLSNIVSVLTISNVDIDGQKDKNVKFTTAELSKIAKVPKGVYFDAILTIPDKCSEDDKLCKVIIEKIAPKTKLFLRGEFKTSGFKLEAGWTGEIDFTKSKSMVLKEVKLVLVFDAVQGISISLVGKMTIDGKMLEQKSFDVECSLAVSASGEVKITGKQIGMWNQPLGFEPLAIGNALLSIGVSPMSPVSSFEIGGEMHLGQIGTDNVIKSKIYVGLNIAPQKNYFYADIKPFSLGDIAKAMNFKTELPQTVLDTGFPEGVMISFTLFPGGQTIGNNIKINNGFVLKGKINILGYTLDAKIEISATKIAVFIQMSPIELGNGAIILRASEKDDKKGPKISIAIETSGAKVQIQGWLQVAVFAAGVDIDVSPTFIHVSTSVMLKNLFKAEVTVEAGYKKLLKDAGFLLKVTISTDVTSQMNSKTHEEATIGAKDGEEAQKLAEDNVKNSKGLFQKAEDKFRVWGDELNQKEEEIEKKANKIQSLGDILDDSCKQKCPKDIPKTKLKWKSQCREMFKIWFGCFEKVVSTTKMARDPACLAKCKLDKVGASVKAAGKKVKLEALIKTFEALKKLVEIADGFVKKSQAFVEAVDKGASELNEKAKIGLKALEDLKSKTIDKFVKIHTLSFEVALKGEIGACFKFNADITFLEKERKKFAVDVCIDKNFIVNVGKALVGYLYKGMGTIKEGITKAKEWFKKAKTIEAEVTELDNQADKLEAEMAKLKIPDEPKAQKPKKRGTIESYKATLQNSTQKIAYWRAMAYGSLPSVAIRDADTLEAFDITSPWASSEEDDPLTLSNEKSADAATESSPVLDTRVLDDTSTTSCMKAKTALTNYGVIADSLNFLLDNMNTQRQSFLDEARKSNEKVKELERSAIQSAKEDNYSEEQFENAMFYVRRLKNGTLKWMQNVRRQLDEEDQITFSKWKDTIKNMVGVHSNEELQAYVNKLRTTMELSKRDQIFTASDAHASLDKVGQMVTSILQTEEGKTQSITSKKDTIVLLSNEIDNIRDNNKLSC